MRCCEMIHLMDKWDVRKNVWVALLYAQTTKIIHTILTAIPASVGASKPFFPYFGSPILILQILLPTFAPQGVNLLAPQTSGVEPEPKFHISGSGSSISKVFAPAPIIQNCLGSGSTNLPGLRLHKPAWNSANICYFFPDYHVICEKCLLVGDRMTACLMA